MAEIEVEIEEDVFLPCYRHLLDDAEIDIDFIYGSRDSGKSRNTAMLLVMRCLEAKYFRHIIARKVFSTIQDSQWLLIKDVIEDWGISHLFTFTKKPLEITCKINGNKFLARGFDDPQKIKSIQNPSGAWVEEGNQLTKDDWVVLLTSVRSNHGKTKIDITFNPECDGDYRKYWLYKDYFSHTNDLSFTNTRYVTIAGEEFPITYRATHTTYHDNPYCAPQRKAIYESLKTTSPYHYRIYGLGFWGNRENQSPFVLTFNREKHLHHTEFDPSKVLYLSFDFNRNPMCCSVIQWDGGVNVDWIEVIKIPNSTIWTMCEVIRTKYPDAIFIVCGDYSGNNKSALIKYKDEADYYQVIKKELILMDTQIQAIVNPRIEDNQVLVNFCFAQLSVSINPVTCDPLVFDIEFVEMRADGTLKKNDRDDPTQQADALDTMRYFFNRYFHHLNPLK